MYYESLKNYCYGEYLTESPKKDEVLRNARVDGKIKLLPESNNRAITIETAESIFLQSYDTLILEYVKKAGRIKKMWTGYSKTTLKHINTFLEDLTGQTFNKKEWEEYKGV